MSRFKGTEALAELRIKEALRRGELDDLPGAGKPLELHDLAGLSRQERIEALLMRSVGDTPEEVNLLRELAELGEGLDAESSDGERARIRAAMHAKAVRLSVLFERSGRNLSARDVMDRFG
ncbi:MAG: DUF1992 domain-containing protein [Deltaproteobacteria bacterium]|jgi:hypothetical protein|nr:DUF1992 domain-containing protein [Deltaproteobacteria bacterium]MBW2535024.1 DUF1992 domain-containing protein [Deltaproteobacteria bacterium]